MCLTLHRQANQSNRDPYSSQSQPGRQPGSAKGVQMAQKRPWKPSMGLVPSSQTGSIPPRPTTAAGVRRLARPADAHTASQPRMSFSQPNSFQDYTPTGTPDRQYMMPGDFRQPHAAAHLSVPCSQPCSGLDSTECTPVGPTSTQSFSQQRPVSFSPAYHQAQGLSQAQSDSSLRLLPSGQRQPSPVHHRQMLPQQQPVRSMQRPLHFTVLHSGSQSMTPQSSHRESQGGQALQSSQGMPPMFMTQPSQDTVAWSEETQADPPILSQPSAHQPYLVQEQQQQQPLHQSECFHQPEPITALEAGPDRSAQPVGSHPSRLLMKIKSRAAAEAINNAVPSPAASSKEPNLSSLPSMPIPAATHDDQTPQQSPSLLEAADKAASEAAVAGGATAAATAAASEAAEQAKQAVAAAVAAQQHCKAMAATALAAASADKENQQSRHVEMLEKMTGVMQSCADVSTSMATLQGTSDAHATRLTTVESTCQVLVGLMHGLASQTEQALVAFKTPQLPQLTTRVLRCLDNFTQTSPACMTHQGSQADPAMMGAAVHTALSQGIENSPTPDEGKKARAAKHPFGVATQLMPVPPAVAVAKAGNTPSPGAHRGVPKAQDKPSQKRKLPPGGRQQQQERAKQQKTVYNEFSTSTEGTTDSERTMPSQDVVHEVSSPSRQSPQATKAKASKHQQAQLQVVAKPVKVTAVVSPEAALPLPAALVFSGKGLQKGTSISPLPCSSAAQAADPSTGISRLPGPNRAAGLLASKPSQSQAAAVFSRHTDQFLPKTKPNAASKPSSFAALLEAVLSQSDHEPALELEPADDALGVKLDPASSLSGPKGPVVVAGGSNNQAKRADLPPKQQQQSSSKATAASLADAKEAKQNAELKSYSRRSAWVQAKKAQSTPASGHDQHTEQQKGGSSMYLFATTDQVSWCIVQELMPSIDDEDIERQVRERMQRHRLKNMKRFSRMKS
ncbi:TPA: hypothetical protein ACH3X1_005513 [Trebouxia sp. C0004]